MNTSRAERETSEKIQKKHVSEVFLHFPIIRSLLRFDNIFTEIISISNYFTLLTQY